MGECRYPRKCKGGRGCWRGRTWRGPSLLQGHRHSRLADRRVQDSTGSQGDRVGEVGHVSEEMRKGEGWGNRTRDKHRRLLFRLISACAMQPTDRMASTHGDQITEKHTSISQGATFGENWPLLFLHLFWWHLFIFLKRFLAYFLKAKYFQHRVLHFVM